ncbi:hypothetical protein HYZ82_00895 [Candidatus Nomurabacteria bacterium]|nr:hypothetical protein [Candidatus Nomurabacteria bacterium]
MIKKIKDKKNSLPAQSGFLQLIIIIIIALLIMKYFGLTFSGILAYLGLTWAEIIGWFKAALDWLKDLFISVK